jgi:hypothetical protein
MFFVSNFFMLGLAVFLPLENGRAGFCESSHVGRGLFQFLDALRVSFLEKPWYLVLSRAEPIQFDHFDVFLQIQIESSRRNSRD